MVGEYGIQKYIGGDSRIRESKIGAFDVASRDTSDVTTQHSSLSTKDAVHVLKRVEKESSSLFLTQVYDPFTDLSKLLPPRSMRILMYPVSPQNEMAFTE